MLKRESSPIDCPADVFFAFAFAVAVGVPVIRRTADAVGLSRVPSQSGHCTSSSSSMRSIARSASSSASSSVSKREVSGTIARCFFGTFPWPRQVPHQPRGELKENRRGSSSSKDWLQHGQLDCVDSRMNFLSAVKSLMRPLPTVSVRSMDWSRFGAAEAFPWRLKSAVTTSMSCSLKRSRRVKFSASRNCRSTRSLVNPCFSAHSAISV